MEYMHKKMVDVLLSCTQPLIGFINLTRNLKYTRVDGFKHLMNTFEFAFYLFLDISKLYSIRFPDVRFRDNPVCINIHWCLPEWNMANRE